MPSRQLDHAEALDWAFAQARTAKLATVTAKGAPHVAPVWVVRDGDTIWFNTGKGTSKGKAIARDPRISMCFDDETPPFTYVIVDGTAEIVTDRDKVKEYATRIGGRYMGDDVAERYGERNSHPDELLIEVTVTKAHGWADIAD
jgi:PPOX class probable F420-dependent enzyme